MTRAPWVLPKPDRAFPARDVTAVSTTLGWRLVNPAMPAEWTVSLGESNEQLRDEFGISRERQDEFAARSHRLAHEAWEAGFYDDLTVPVAEPDPRRGHPAGLRHLDKLAKLKPSFRPDGTITAGNASPLNDGASAVLLGSAGAASVLGRVAGGPGRRPRRRTRWSRSGSATRRSRRPTGRWSGPASAGRTSARSS